LEASAENDEFLVVPPSAFVPGLLGGGRGKENVELERDNRCTTPASRLQRMQDGCREKLPEGKREIYQEILQ
jgi:hypothetical protein